MFPQEYQEFNRFLDRLDEYLHNHGWYINGDSIRQKCHSYQEVKEYLTRHCYDTDESVRIIHRLREEIQNILTSPE